MVKWEKKLEAALKTRDHKIRDLEEAVASLSKKLQEAVETVKAVEKTNQLPLQGKSHPNKPILRESIKKPHF